MTDHMTDDVDWRPSDGWYTARCSCGWSEGPFRDLETMVDALMDHAASRLGAAIDERDELHDMLDAADASHAGLALVLTPRERDMLVAICDEGIEDWSDGTAVGLRAKILALPAEPRDVAAGGGPGR